MDNSKATKTYDIKELNLKSVNDLIAFSENIYQKQMLQITKSIINNRKTKFVLVAGPSSSGKTTTSHILQQDLLKVGICAKVISLDNFFSRS